MHQPTSLRVPVGRLTHSVAVRLIVHLKGEGNYAYVHTSDGRYYLITQSLGQLAARFPGFWRLHKSHLVNPAYVTGQLPACLRLRNGEQLPIARRRKKTIAQLVKQLSTN